MTAKGLLLVTMEPPAGLEEEFNDWYDTEHVPQRRALPGFESATRWVCLSGWPRWLALYDLATLTALETPEYKAVSGQNSTPWTRRLLPRTIGLERVLAEQVLPGAALIGAPETICRLLVARYVVHEGEHDPFIEEFERMKKTLQGLSQARIFRSASPNGAEFWIVAEFTRPAAVEPLQFALGSVGGFDARQFNFYAPYRRG